VAAQAKLMDLIRAEINENGSLRRLDCASVVLSLFPGNEVEGGPANLYLRLRSGGDTVQWTPLLGPSSPTQFRVEGSTLTGRGEWLGVGYSLALVLARSAPVWFWHVQLHNRHGGERIVDLTYSQDIALASYGAVRLNEFYVSQYLDHTPLRHNKHGTLIATRQNQAVDGRYPWSLIGSLREGVGFATDALQFHGLATRAGETPSALSADLPNQRLQHEHAMVVIRDAPLSLGPGASASAGFFGLFVADHPEATAASDAERVAQVLALAEAHGGGSAAPDRALRGATTSAARATGHAATGEPVSGATLFSSAPLLRCADLDDASLQRLFPPSWRSEERDDQGRLLSFFHAQNSHVVLGSKERQVLRPHGHLLRTGRHLTPDETALTSTTWMNGVFHSMVTQGHVSINRFLSTTHSYLGLFRSHGQRVFVEIEGQWQLLGIPCAFEMSPTACRWIYRHSHGEIEVAAEAKSDPRELSLRISSNPPARLLVSHHVSLNGDDGSAPGAANWTLSGETIVVTAAAGGDVGRRFPSGSFHIAPTDGARFEKVGGDELLFLDGRSRQQPFVCIVTEPSSSVGLRILGELVTEQAPAPLRVASPEELIPEVRLSGGAEASALAGLAEIAPWYAHNALVHYLSPRGLEQYSGGGWGTRDVCQGPVELLLALGKVEPVRDLILRVLSNQNPDGDWPQWFMFFERERDIRPGDSHGDIVFWPLLVVAQYLIASDDAALLDERIPFFSREAGGGAGAEAGGKPPTVWQHIQRALSLIEKRVLPGTALAAYGHGDWNDSLQPADPRMRENMCSAWTVTLHFQTLTTLARALASTGRAEEARRLNQQADAVRKDFQLLISRGVLTGYALYEGNGEFRYLLHPSDRQTGVRYSSLAMIHAILEDLLTPAQVREHLKIIDEHLSGPDGIRLFDCPMPYHGGPQKFFQRAESATFFGREIGLMYMHAHLRYAQALAHLGEADRFFQALCLANPVGIRSIVSSATLRQGNCYYSSSDAAFADRYRATAEYGRVVEGQIALDGGWRVYSSGAGIALGLIVRRFLGLSQEARALRLDPVMPVRLDGLRAQLRLLDRDFEVRYRVGAPGCGVREVTLNGQALKFTSAENPHRTGAALIEMSAVRQAMTPGKNVLEIRLGAPTPRPPRA
jgi:1,2-beta-oligoglucan phosphorylase